MIDRAANAPYRLPPSVFSARCKVCWFLLGLACLVAASFWSLDLHWSELFSGDSPGRMGKFLAEFLPPDASAGFLRQIAWASWETVAMSALGTALALVGALFLAVPASRAARGRGPVAGAARESSRLVLSALRAIPELVWASLLLVSAGLGPFAGTLALAVHTTGVLGRLFADALENVPPGPGAALRTQGVGGTRLFLYATLPQVLPQLASYALYRWENNIRAAAVLGVVGAGGLGQLLYYHLSLFHWHKTASILLAMLALVALVDALSYALRSAVTR